MSSVALQGKRISKTFNRRKVFSNIDFSIPQAQAWAIVGKNGSGKSTLVKIIASVLSATSGEVVLSLDGKSVHRQAVFNHLGFVAPYLQLYDEFTAYENLMLFKELRGGHAASTDVRKLLERINLYQRKDDLVRTYSSGMKQRLKYAFAMLHQPAVLVLDEPTTNLDAEGITLVHELVDEQRKRGIVIIASNDREDIDLCDAVIDLHAQGNAMSGGEV